MSRYINADALMKKLKQHHDFYVNGWGGFKEMPKSDKARCDELSNSIAEIFNAPSIDIVFCKECEHYEDGRCESDEMWGSIFGYTTECEYMSRNDDDFCSFGERREP